MQNKQVQRDPIVRMRRLVRVAEREGPGTGQTTLKRWKKPVEALIEAKEIGAEEKQAAEDIAAAVHDLCSSCGLAPGWCFDRVDGGRSDSTAIGAVIAKRVERYQMWADHWSGERARNSNPMLEVIFAAVVDERPIRDIAADVCRHHKTVRHAIAAGLRDYAARAGWVTGVMCRDWQDEAQAAFFRPVYIRRREGSEGNEKSV